MTSPNSRAASAASFLTRRQLLRGTACAVVLVGALSSFPARAAGPVYKLERVASDIVIPSAAGGDGLTTAQKNAMSRAFRKTLILAKNEAKTLPVANGMLTKVGRFFGRYSWVSMVPLIVSAGIEIGNILLADGSIVNIGFGGTTRSGNSPSSCTALPAPPSNITDLPQGLSTHKNHATTCTGSVIWVRFQYSGSNYSAPSGWTRRRAASLGGGLLDVIISKNFAPGDPYEIPPLPPGAIADVLNGGEEIPASELDKLVDAAVKTALVQLHDFDLLADPAIVDPGTDLRTAVPTLPDASTDGLTSPTLKASSLPSWPTDAATAPGVKMPVQDEPDFGSGEPEEPVDPPEPPEGAPWWPSILGTVPAAPGLPAEGAMPDWQAPSFTQPSPHAGECPIFTGSIKGEEFTFDHFCNFAETLQEYIRPVLRFSYALGAALMLWRA
ncbi:hypothetical protein FJQ54_13060 [Sandaracinobacter neustonicus]|uniref:Uncharacterized protein n=1 Tax=Sandaracinobacter neustonicus TaxID=1715348 RepID=A0A501XFW3_9SPHN|nr:hypothetical protein [Sandaracinobacter neustonicus]TPE59420.1 hypothetical protein FJQ54_13060 [Sandaracinobacter neustonicus]